MSLIFTVLVFALVLIVLIVVHELGHFVVAKLTGMRVDEFGIGYPPRIAGFRYGETEYTLNALPFGGFVRIFGEDDPEQKGTGEQETVNPNPRAFASRPKLAQAATLVAGIFMNLLLAYILITATLLMGTPRALDASELTTAKNVTLMVAHTIPGSPAEKVGIRAGDTLVALTGNGAAFTSLDQDQFSKYIATDTDKHPLTFTILRNGVQKTFTATPIPGVLPTLPDRPGLGLAVAPVGIVPVPIMQAPKEGAILTAELTKETAVGLVSFFGSIFSFHANLSEVAGPVGIATTVGNAAHEGLASLLSISAIISINLAVINLLPIPALDGGRLLFVIIEAITRKPIKSRVAQAINTTSFALLILLMVVVTGHDLYKIFK